MKKIALGGKYGVGKFSLVDDEDYEYLSQFRWSFPNGYVSRTQYFFNEQGIKKSRIVRMNREIMGFPKGMLVDHINHNTLDNRRGNLRVCTNQQNMMNQKPHKDSKSKFKGIFFNTRDSNWRARIKVDGKLKSLGAFLKAEDAAKAYDKAAKALYGEFAYLNFN